MVARLSEGAEAVIYSCKALGLDAVIKDRVRKGYRIGSLDERIRTARTKNEARILALAANAGINTPRVLLADRYSICMTRIRGRNLNKMADSGNMKGIFYRLGAYAAALHNAGIAHGDYTPANAMIDGKGRPYVIDFGLSVMTDAIEEKALDLLLMKRSISQQQYKTFVAGYKRSAKNVDEVLRRLAKIEKRGRYNTRTLLLSNVDKSA